MGTTRIQTSANKADATKVIRWLGGQPDGCSEAGLVRAGVLPVTRARHVLTSLAVLGAIRKVKRPRKGGGMCTVWVLAEVA